MNTPIKMASILFSESKGGRVNPLRELTKSLDGASSSREIIGSRRLVEHLKHRNPDVKLDPWEELELSNVWEHTLSKSKDDELEVSEEERAVINRQFDDYLCNHGRLSHIIISLGYDSDLRLVKHLTEIFKIAENSSHDFDEVEERNILIYMSSMIKNNVIQEFEAYRRGEYLSGSSKYRYYFDLILKDGVKSVNTRYMNKMSQLVIFHLYDHLESPDKSFPIDTSKTPLDDYISRKGDLFNYMEIITELSQGNILPGARHALAIYYKMKKMCEGESIFLKKSDEIFLRKLLITPPLEMANLINLGNNEYINLVPYYSNSTKLVKQFKETYRYVCKNPGYCYYLYEYFSNNKKEYVFSTDFNLGDEINKWKNVHDNFNLHDYEKFFVESLIKDMKRVLMSGKIRYLPSFQSKL